jgi:hypothetical protein
MLSINAILFKIFSAGGFAQVVNVRSCASVIRQRQQETDPQNYTKTHCAFSARMGKSGI